MKTLLLVAVVILATATMTWAAPFCVCTKGVGGTPTSYEFSGLPLVPVVVPAQPDGNFKIDLGALLPGSYTIRVRAINLTGVSSWSDPLAFTLEALPGKPMVPSLSAQ
jgi:hypothetical protein